MATELHDYFNTRLTQELERNEQLGVSTKYEAVQKASQEKVEILRASRLRQEETYKANKTSVMGQLGLSPDSVLGGAVNLGVSSAAGVAETVGTVGNAAATLAGYGDAGQEFQEATNISSRIAANDEGTKTSSIQRRIGDLGSSALKGAIAVPEMAVGLASMVSGGVAGKYLEEVGFRPEEAKQFLDTLRTHEQQAASQNVNGAEGFWNTMGQIADNPSVVPHALLESLFPMLAGGVVGKGLQALGAGAKLAAAAGEGTVMAGSAAEQIRQQSQDGRLSFKQALAAGATGVMGAGVARLSGMGAARLGLGDIDEAVVAGTFGKSKHGAAVRTVGAGAFEGGEEMLQSTGEQMLQNSALDKDLTQGVGNAAAMGLVTGAALGAPMGLAQDAREKAVKAVAEGEKQKAAIAAIASGDVSELTDPTKPAYAPESAVAALVGIVQKPDTTPEQKQTHLDKANSIIAELEDAKDLQEHRINTSTAQGIEAQIASLKARALKPENAHLQDAVNSSIEGLQEKLADLPSAQEAAAIQADAKTKLDVVNGQIAQAMKSMEVLESKVLPAADVDALVATATQDLTPTTDPVVDAQNQTQAKEAAEKVFVLAMRNPERVAPEAAMALADSLGNGLTEQQRSHLRMFSEARIAANALRDAGEVHTEIFKGSNDNLGLADYRSAIPQALKANRQDKADGLLDKLGNFAMGHQAKAVVVAQAYQQALKEGKAVSVRKDADGWAVGAPFASEKERAANGGLNIGAHSQKLVAGIAMEAGAINKTLDEMQSAYDLSFNPGAKSVKNVSPSNAGSTGTPQPVSTKTQTAPAARGTNGVPATAPDTTAAVDAVPRPETRPVPAAGVSTTTTAGTVGVDVAALPARMSKADADVSQLSNTLDTLIADYSAKRYAKELAEHAALDKLNNLTKEQEARYVELERITSSVHDAVHAFVTGKSNDSAAVAAVIGDAGLVEAQKLKATWAVADKEYQEVRQLVSLVERLPSLPNTQLNAAINNSKNKEIPGYLLLLKERTRREVAHVPTAPAVAPVTPDATGQNNAVAATTPVTPVEETKVEVKLESKDSITETNSTTQRTDSTESAEQTSVDSPVPVETGPVLTVFADTSPEGTPFHLRNAIAEGFRQTAKREGDATGRPLATVKNFVTTYLANPSLIWDYLAVDALSTEQQAALDLFMDKYQEWEGTIRRNLPTKAIVKKFRHQDPMRYLLNVTEDGKVDLDENIKVAIAYAVFGYVAEEAPKSAFLKAESINALLGREKDERVSRFAWETLGTAGVYEHTLIDSLGGRVMEALGLEDMADTPQDLLPTVRMALGAHAMALLEKEKLIVRTTVPGAKIRKMREEGLTAEGIEYLHKTQGVTYDLPHYFYAIARDGQHQPVPAAAEIAAANKNTQGILGQLFKVTGGVTLPALDVVTTVKNKTAGTDMGVPGVLKEVQVLNQSRPRKVRGDTLSFLESLPKEVVHAMMGVTEVNEKTTHLVNRMAEEAKNASLVREYDMFMEYVSDYLAQTPDGLETPFYMTFSVWKQQRVGIANTAVNPQTSKVVRWMLGSPEWTSTIDSENTEAMESFYLRVGEGLGVKTEHADSAINVGLIKSKLQEPVYAKAIAALRKSAVHKEALTAQEQSDVAAGVKEGKAKMHTLDVLIGMAYQQEAQSTSNGSPYTFTTQMMGEVDGVANGTMLNHMLLGAALGSEEHPSELPMQGGFYTEASGHTQYNQYRGTAGNMDVYESTARRIYDMLTAMFGKEGTQTTSHINSIWEIAGEIVDVGTGKATSDGRSLVKDALNPLGFGSSLKSLGNGMADSFIAAIYAKFEALSVNNASQEEVDFYIWHVNNMIWDKSLQFAEGTTIAAVMETVLAPQAEASIRKVFKDTVGMATEEVINADFAQFIANKNVLNSTAQATFGVFDALYTGMREAFIEELLAKGEIPVDEKGRRIGDLSKKQEKALKRRMHNLLPIIQSVSSKDDHGTGTGMLMAKSERKQNTDGAYAITVQFGDALGNGKNSVGVRGITATMINPGVAMGSATTHSLDSSISHMTQMFRDVLNIHDAVGDGVLGLKESARLMNKHTWDALLKYSPLSEVYQSLENMVVGLANMVENKELTPQALAYVQGYLKTLGKSNKMSPAKALSNMLTLAKEAAYGADSAKLSFLAQLVSVDQYAFQGGNYAVTAEDRASALAKKSELSRVFSSEAQKALATLAIIMEMKLDAVVVTPVAVVDASDTAQTFDVAETQAGDTEAAEAVGEAVEETHPLGELGESAIAPDTDLLAFFTSNPKSNAKRVIGGLLTKYTNDTSLPNREFMVSLLRQLRSTVPADLAIEYVTARTKESDLLSDFQKGVRGWYTHSPSASAIYVLSPDFKDSGLTPELLVHEIVHAALYQTMQNTTDPQVRAHVENLQALLGKAKEFAQKNGLEVAFRAAFESLDEFVTWGMTNADFQKEVLTQFYTKPKNNTKSIVTAMKEMISHITGLLFASFKRQGMDVRKAYGLNENGMAVLINDVTQLLQKTRSASNTGSGSTTTTVMGMASPAAKVMAYSTQDLFQALNTGDLTAAFQEHLGGVLSGIVHKLHGPFGAFKAEHMAGQAGSPMDTWLKALDTGVAPFASKLLKAGLPISQEEAFVMEQVEATVAAALEDNSTTARTAYRELYRLYTEVASKVHAKDFHNGDWATATPDEQNTAQTAYDAIFVIEAGVDGRSDYLSRFAAFGLAHQGFNKVLQQATERDTRRVMDGKTFAERLRNVFDKFLRLFAGKITGTYSGQNADTKLSALVSQLIDIEAKRKHTLAEQAKRSTDHTEVDKLVAGIWNTAKDAIVLVTETDLVKKSRSHIVRGVGAMANTVAQNRMLQFAYTITKIRDKNFEGKPGVLAGILNNVKGPNEVIEYLVRMTKKNEKQRKQIITNTAKFVRESFENGGKNLTEENKTAITSVFLRTGLHTLLDRMSMADLGNLLGNKQATAAAIAAVEAELVGFGSFGHYFKHQADGLAYYRATGNTAVPFLMMNAYNIARMVGTAHEGRLSALELAQAEKSIEQLVALYALHYTKSTDTANARELFRDEAVRTDGNGVEYALRLHKHMEQESKERLFGDNRTLMVHGHTPEITNTHVEVVAASAAEGKELLYRGYELVHKLSHDPADPDVKNESLYVLKDGGLQRYASGAMSLTSLKSLGSSKHDGYLNTRNYYGALNASNNAGFMAGKQQEIASMFKPGPVGVLNQLHLTYAAPTLNEKGEVVNWRYLMSDKTKDTVLQRTNDFDLILGTLAGATYDKETSKDQNKGVLVALKEMFDAEYATQPHSYVQVSAKSSDPEMREIWQMLSDATKAEAKGVFGESVIYVRKDSVDAIFGYRKMSLADSFKRDPATRNIVEKVMVNGLEGMLALHYRAKGKSWDEAEKHAKRAALYVTQGERIWQELVHEVKDIIVVKTGTVLVGNILSNLSLLYLKGVPLLDIGRYHVTAFRGAIAYKKDSEQLERLQGLLDTGQYQGVSGGVQQIHKDIRRLENELARNPVKELMDAGLMPTIVEDVAADADIYSYKSALVRKVDAMTPDKATLLVKAARQVYMAHDTTQYKFLSQVTQLSDFVARYTLYQHQISRKNNPLSKQAAIHEASETFVNYDLPMQRNLQYLDDMGLTPFMKYFLNIQRVLQKTVRENPARVLMLALTGQMVDLGPIVLSSAAVTRIGNNPLQWGAFKLPGSLDDLATVSASLALLK